MVTREVVGVLERSGARPDVQRLAAALGGGHVLASGPLAIAFTGPQAHADGGALALVDGALDRDPRHDAEGPPARPEQALLEAWRTRGGALLDALRGEFAVLLWDGARGLLARDHIGSRSWVFHDDGTRLRFATEAHLLLRLLPVRPAPEPLAVAEWLSIGGPPADTTLYAGVRRVLPAGWIALDAREPPRPARYWTPVPVEPRLAQRAEHVERIRASLRRAVVRRAQEPEATALLLSGGLDSSTVGALLAAEDRASRAYSAVFPEHPRTDETEQIDALCAAYGLRSVRAQVRGGSALAGALAYTRRWELPPVSPNVFFWQPLLQRAAADGTKVTLDGEGGDELFGFSFPLVGDRLARGDLLGALSLVYRVPGAEGRPTQRSMWRVLRQLGLPALAPAWLYDAKHRRRPDTGYMPPWLSEPLRRDYLASEDPIAWKRLGGPRWWSYLVDVTTRGAAGSLAYDHLRQRGALAGVAARHPLMDRDVVETVLQTPPELAFDPYVSRPLLREAMAGLMPEAVRSRPTKSTFDPIFHSALLGADLPVAQSLLGDPHARLRAYARPEVLRAHLVDAEPPPAGRERMLWAVWLWRAVTLECWLRLQEDPEAAVAKRLAAPEIAFVAA